jgi:predicted DNA-binding antitoxin AbrB/MazE fold protein
MQLKAVYRDEVLKPLQKLNLPEKAKVRITIKGSFSELLDELGEVEAKEDINKVLDGMRMRNYYG